MCRLRDIHDDLEMIGLIPGLGEPADILNAAIYAAEGDYKNAGLSGASVLPVASYVATPASRQTDGQRLGRSTGYASAD